MYRTIELDERQIGGFYVKQQVANNHCCRGDKKQILFADRSLNVFKKYTHPKEYNHHP